jgi:hypothetical protein
MRVLTKFCLLACLAGCGAKTADMRLYPVEGPIALSHPSQVISIATTYRTETSGDIAFRMPAPSRVRCSGTWTSVVPKVASHERGLKLGLRDTGGSYTNSSKDVGGINAGEVYAICTDGTRVQGRFITGSGTESGTGRVTDTLGNTYKLLF